MNSTSPKLYKLGILGCGSMGGAILQAIIGNKLIDANKICIYDSSSDIINRYKTELNVDFATNEFDLFTSSEYVLFAIKPQIINEVLSKIKSAINQNKSSEDLIKGKTIVSIAAGIPISVYEEFNNKLSVIRVMPNILALVNQAASALTRNKNTVDIQYNFVKNIFEKIGITVDVKEELFDVITGLSGSGPAYIAVMIESLADGAVKMGLPRDIAYKLAAQTVSGTGKMILEKQILPAQLKDMVSSPGGTTIAGLHAMEKGNFRNAVISAVEAATQRSKELRNSK
jgi:pyrroline-5-carboxylate reductase